jgi:uncharacterized protein DUF5670
LSTVASWRADCTIDKTARRRVILSRGGDMLVLVFLLLVLWFLGMVSSYTLGGLLHILLVIAVVLFLVHIIQGRPIGEA